MTHKKFLIFCFAGLSLSSAALAAEPRLLQSYGKWDAYSYQEGSNKVCYMAAIPEKTEGAKVRGDVHVLITHRPSDGTRNVFSYIAGYPYKPATDATLDIDGKKFILFTKDEMAWALNSETDSEITQAIRSGTKMIVTGTSTKGTRTKDMYSLTGSSGAYERISKECN